MVDFSPQQISQISIKTIGKVLLHFILHNLLDSFTRNALNYVVSPCRKKKLKICSQLSNLPEISFRRSTSILLPIEVWFHAIEPNSGSSTRKIPPLIRHKMPDFGNKCMIPLFTNHQCDKFSPTHWDIIASLHKIWPNSICCSIDELPVVSRPSITYDYSSSMMDPLLAITEAWVRTKTQLITSCPSIPPIRTHHSCNNHWRNSPSLECN